MRRGANILANATKARLYSGAAAETSGRILAPQLPRTLADSVARLGTDLERVPVLVRSIWGKSSEGILDALRSQQPLTRQLVRRWEDAEHRLIAVANSLASNSGQRVVAVGVPLVAAQLMGLWSVSHAYHVAPEQRCLAPQRAKPARIALPAAAAAAVTAALRAVVEEAMLVARAAFLGLLFLPCLLSTPALWLGDAPRAAWMRLVAATLARSGPAFIKWAQWAATRPDIFPADACAAMATLQAGAPAHSFSHTRATVEGALGCPLVDMFDSFEAQPVASGSIAQVRHPAVVDLIERDIQLMRRGAALLELFGISGQLRESIMQFGAPLREQLDLSVEAEHLDRFASNFRSWSGVRFPLPAGPKLVTPDVLVETFEDGQLIANFLESEGERYNKRLAGLGLACYLKMLLRDNFIHADMHPGNILVHMEEPLKRSILGRVNKWMGLDLRLPQLVLLDVGMAARLTPADQGRLVSFFKHLTALDGRGLADAIVSFSEEPPAPARAAAFRDDLGHLFDGLDTEALRANTSEVVAGLMDSIRRNNVQLRGVVSTVIITTCVLEGWSTRLDPGIRMMESLRDILPAAWGERASRSLDAALSGTSILTMAAAC